MHSYSYGDLGTLFTRIYGQTDMYLRDFLIFFNSSRYFSHTLEIYLGYTYL